ncbi:MAG TPA: ABC transporter permease [Gammaproteobacteria bacterium]
MLMHYLYVALRNARRGPFAFVMNVLTLAVGLACFVTVYGFVDFWRSADRHFANADRIYAVTMEFEARVGSFAMGAFGAPEPLAELLRADFPQIERVVRAVNLGRDAVASALGRALTMSAAATGPEFFELFDLPFAAGDPRRALSQPRSVVLTREFATQLFGDADPLGQPVLIGNAVETTVTGLLAPIPEPSHMGRSTSATFRFDALVSEDVLEAIRARAREIGLRKSLGARPGQIVVQALLEAALAAVVAIVLALAGYRLAARAFTALIGTDPTRTLFDGAGFWLFLIALVAGVTLAAGAYPALVLSRVRPVATLRGAAAGRAAGRLPAALVAVQFTVASFLLMVVAVTALENAHLKRTGLGIAEDPLLVITRSSPAANVSAETLRAELERLPQVRGVTEMAAPPFLGFSLTVVRNGPEQTVISRTVFSHTVGHDFFAMFDVPLLAGRLFSRDHDDMPAVPPSAPPPPGSTRSGSGSRRTRPCGASSTTRCSTSSTRAT